MVIPRHPESLKSRADRHHAANRGFLRLTRAGGASAPASRPLPHSPAPASAASSCPLTSDLCPLTSAPKAWLVRYAAEFPVRFTGFAHNAAWSVVENPLQASIFPTEDAALTAAINHGMVGLTYSIVPLDLTALPSQPITNNE
jgi:hypothetical protein